MWLGIPGTIASRTAPSRDDQLDTRVNGMVQPESVNSSQPYSCSGTFGVSKEVVGLYSDVRVRVS